MSRRDHPAGPDVRLSKRLAHVLRHDPASVGVALDAQGWTDVEALLAALARAGPRVTRADLERVVAGSDKQRFALDGDRIRAQQGHTVPVDLGLTPVPPPEVLFHGTVARSLPAILAEGLRAGGRHHVHLSPDVATARAVGSRRGRPVVLQVEAGRLSRSGLVFYRSGNGVWLVDAVPPDALTVLEGQHPRPGAGGAALRSGTERPVQRASEQSVSTGCRVPDRDPAGTTT